MQNLQSTGNRATSASSLDTAEKRAASDLPIQTRQLWPVRLWRTVRRYPIPLGVVTLLLVSLLFWLAGRADLANWTLLVVALLGGLPLLWETMQHFLRREFSVDVIAILAIVGSVLLKEYLAGALIV